MRIAENQHFGSLGLLGQLVEIEFVTIAPIHQSVVNQLPSMTADSVMEWWVNGWLDNDFITRLGESQHCHIETTNNTWHE